MIPQLESLRIDWMPVIYTKSAKIGLSTLPGRYGCGRSLDDDMVSITKANIRAVICLLSDEELAHYGVPDLLNRYRSVEMAVLSLPTRDQFSPEQSQLENAMNWIAKNLVDQTNILIHCVGGLGRAGTIAGCWLRTQGLSGEEAIQVVREFRSPRAIESPRQETAVRDFIPTVEAVRE